MAKKDQPKATNPNSITEQIIEDMFDKLDSHSEFDKNLLNRLRHLNEQGNLSKAASVTKAIKTSGEKDHASA